MVIFLIVYILGVIVTLWASYHNLESGTEVSLFDLLFTVILSLFSWIAFIVVILLTYGGKTVFKKK